MRIRLRFFAALREALGPGEDFECEPGLSVVEVRERLVARGGAYAQCLAHDRVLRCAWNQHMCEPSFMLESDGELALFPPVTGG
jgi:molybdopterin synthase sulfur carrier subunit